MKIETELNIGDIMYVIDAEKGKAVVKNHEITAIKVSVYKDEIVVWYKDNRGAQYTSNHSSYGYAPIVWAFKTFDEAQAYADKLNG